jgi:hypothetical protein
MLKQRTIFMHVGHYKQVGALAEAQGIKTAQLLRIIIAEYLRRNARKAK